MSAELAVLESRPVAIDQGRGGFGMNLFILTEALLFACLFFGYFYLARDSRGPWPPSPPKLAIALLMTALLLSSSAVLYAAERQIRRGRDRAARLAVALTIALGVSFLVAQFFEYRQRLREVRPTTDAYGSIFYTITSVHGAHVALGLCMLALVAMLPWIGPSRRTPHRALRTASLYWHFVDAVWLLIVSLLYVLPAVRH
jgi:heme/copper-type cytochrome/quinol oxidase subunit 3